MCHHIQSWQNIWLRRVRTSNLWSCFQLRDRHQNSINLNYWLWNPVKRVFSGVSAILDFKIINFRQYDCSDEPESPNCQIVELFLTVDTQRKMQNGVNIDVSIDRCEFCKFFVSSNNILSGMIILKNDVIAILSEKVNLISARNGLSTFPVGPDKQSEVGNFSP